MFSRCFRPSLKPNVHVGRLRWKSSTTATAPKGLGSDQTHLCSAEEQIQSMVGRQIINPNCHFDGKSPDMLWEAINDHIPCYKRKFDLPPGFYQVCCPSNDPEELLFDDGATSLHAPGPEWKFRVWAGGRMSFNHSPLRAAKVRDVKITESVVSAKVKGDAESESSKAIVTVRKQLSWKKAPNSDALRGEPSETGSVPESVPQWIEEERDLCFMRSVPAGLTSPETQRKIAPPSDAFYSQRMTPNATLLFRFSALTMNAHKIHFDPEYTRTVYGIPKLVLQGPLTPVLMMAVLREALATLTLTNSTFHTIQQISYKNIAPIFVDENITICCKLSSERPPPDTENSPAASSSQTWKVWIQKGEGEGASLAVLGSVDVLQRSPDEDRAKEFRAFFKKQRKFLSRMKTREGHLRRIIRRINV